MNDACGHTLNSWMCAACVSLFKGCVRLCARRPRKFFYVLTSLVLTCFFFFFSFWPLLSSVCRNYCHQSSEWALPFGPDPEVWLPAPQAFTLDLAACKAPCAGLLLRLHSLAEGWIPTTSGMKFIHPIPLFFYSSQKKNPFHATETYVKSFFMCWIKHTEAQIEIKHRDRVLQQNLCVGKTQ